MASKRILVVDDEPDVIQIVSAVLKTKGYEVETAHDGQMCLESIGRSMPDLLLIDLMMPVVSGLEVVRRLKRDEATQGLPIIVMSAAAKESGKSEEFFREGLGIDDFIAKPFDPLALLGRVEAVLRMSEYGPAKGDAPADPPSEPAAPRPVLPAKGEARPKRLSTAKVGGPTLGELHTLDPSGVVQAFVEAWNTQNFAVEYHCLTPGMTGGLPEKSYVMRREQAWNDDQALAREQRVKRVLTMDAQGDTAHVMIEREDTVRGRTTVRQEQYELVRGDHNWQIKMVRSVK